MFNLYALNLCTFNSYTFLSSICIYQICFLSICMFHCQGQDVFRQTTMTQPWPSTPLKKQYSSLVTYKGNFKKGIISLCEHYEDFKVWKLLSFKLYWFKSNVSILINLLNAELHVDSALGCTSVWHPAFAVPHDLNLLSNSKRLKYGNIQTSFVLLKVILIMKIKIICWNGRGICLMRKCWVTREATASRCVWLC